MYGIPIHDELHEVLLRLVELASHRPDVFGPAGETAGQDLTPRVDDPPENEALPPDAGRPSTWDQRAAPAFDGIQLSLALESQPTSLAERVSVAPQATDARV
jgi:hypothetical protein